MNKRVLALALVGALVAATVDHAPADMPGPGSSPAAVPVATVPPPAVQLAVRNLRKACRAWPARLVVPDPSRRPVLDPPGDKAAICDGATHPSHSTWQLWAALAMVALLMLVLLGFALKAALYVTKGIRELVGSFHRSTAS